MAPDTRAFPATSRKRALVGASGLLAVSVFGIASIAYASASDPRSTASIGWPPVAASLASVKA